MPRRKKHIEAVRFEERGGVSYEIFFPGSKQRVVLVAEGLNHREVKDLLFTAARMPLQLAELNGRVFVVRGRPFKAVAGPYDPLPGECRPDECPRYYVLLTDVEARLWIYYQRRETGVKALALAVALSTREDTKAPPLGEILATQEGWFKKSRKKYEKLMEEVVGGAPAKKKRKGKASPARKN